MCIVPLNAVHEKPLINGWQNLFLYLRTRRLSYVKKLVGIQYWWTCIINSMFILWGELPLLPCLYNRRLRTTMGRTLFKRKGLRRRWSPVMIDISSRLETAHLRKTMVHEMCHVWCSIHYQDISHSDIFLKVRVLAAIHWGIFKKVLKTKTCGKQLKGLVLCGQSVDYPQRHSY